MEQIRAAMAGIVNRLLVQPGESVEAGQDVIVLESMKMEIPVASNFGGVVAEIRVEPGAFVNEDDVLVVLE